MVVLQQTTKTFAAIDLAGPPRVFDNRVDQLVPKPLVVKALMPGGARLALRSGLVLAGYSLCANQHRTATKTLTGAPQERSVRS